MLAVVLIICIVLACWAFRRIVRYIHCARLIDKLPGPATVPIFGNSLQFSPDRVEFAKQARRLWFEYANFGILRLWFGFCPFICLTKSSTAETVLRSNELITKSTNYDFLKPWLGNGLLISTGQKWRSRRKLLTAAFHFSILNDFVDVFNTQALILVDELSHMVDRGDTFDILPFVARCTLDIICETAMGVTVNAQRNHRAKYVQAVNKITRIHFYYERRPWLWIKPIFYLLGYGYEYNRCLEVLKGFTNKVIAERREEYQQRKKPYRMNVDGTDKQKHKALLDLLLSAQEEHDLSSEDIREEVETFMFEGHDTTASGISWAIFLLGHHPMVQEKVVEEMESIFGDSQRMPTAEDLKAMKYLECVIKESMRLYPPVPIIARQATEQFVADGYVIPKGSIVIIVPTTCHRDQSVFGTDFDKFRPDRFVEKADEIARNPYAYIPFSAGPRNCIGQKFAMMEEKVVLSTLIRRFKIRSIERIEDVIAVPDIVLRPADQIAVHLTHRQK